MNYFPTIQRNPSSFSMTPVDKSLVPAEKYGTIYGSGRELYEGNPYTYDVSYTNIYKADYQAIRTFYNVVSTILPFRFNLLNNSHDVYFQSALKVSCSTYNYYNVSFSMETCFSSLEYNNDLYIHNYIQNWTNFTDPFYYYGTFTSIRNTITSVIDSGNGGVVYTNPLGLSAGKQYTLTITPTLISGTLPFVRTVDYKVIPWAGDILTSSIQKTQIVAPVTEITFTAKDYVPSPFDDFYGKVNPDCRVSVFNDPQGYPSSWSLEATLLNYSDSQETQDNMLYEDGSKMLYEDENSQIYE